MVTGGAMTPSFPLRQNQFTRAEVQLVVDEAHRNGLPVAAHCHGIDGIAMAVDVGVDQISSLHGRLKLNLTLLDEESKREKREGEGGRGREEKIRRRKMGGKRGEEKSLR